MGKFKIEKKRVCEIDPKELATMITVTKLQNSKRCMVEFDGETFITKSCSLEDITSKIQKNCACACERKIRL
jgi:hypothetical protein